MKIIHLFVVFMICFFFSPSFSEEYTNDEGSGESFDEVGSGSDDRDEVTSFKPELPASPSKDVDVVVTEDVHFDNEGDQGLRAEPEIDGPGNRSTQHDQLSLKNRAVLALMIGGAIFVLLIILLIIMFVVYRLRKKDEGSYALDENMKKKSKNIVYTKAPSKQDEFFA